MLASLLGLSRDVPPELTIEPDSQRAGAELLLANALTALATSSAFST
jgi:hypothetical protein